jgi:protein-S-isoprenylcysteine O-methyltransferase Ste14
MPLELLFKLSFVLLFVSAVAIRVHYQRLAGTYSQGAAKHAASHLAHEAKPLLIIRPLLGLPWYGVVLCWFFAPQWVSWTFLRLPLWARAAGLVLAGLGLLLLWLSHRALGKNFRPTLEASPDQELVTTGPYQYVRHPLYLAFLLMLTSTGLLSSNWFIGVSRGVADRVHHGSQDSGRGDAFGPALRRTIPPVSPAHAGFVSVAALRKYAAGFCIRKSCTGKNACATQDGESSRAGGLL